MIDLGDCCLHFDSSFHLHSDQTEFESRRANNFDRRRKQGENDRWGSGHQEQGRLPSSNWIPTHLIPRNRHHISETVDL
jgi:hypothetical protein